MSTHSFGAFINHDSAPPITGPSAVLNKDDHARSSVPDAYELDEMTWGSRYNGPGTSAKPSGAQTGITPNELEMSRPPSPSDDAAVPVQSLNNPSINKWRFLSACLMCLGNGLNDSAPGALIPYMERDYGIGYGMVSLIFVTNALGFVSAAFMTHALQSRFGRARALMLAEAVMIAAYIMIVCTPPFPVVVVAFFLTGLGMAVNLSLNNVFCANLVNSTTTLGAFHGSYGIGGTVGPLIATAMATHGIVWSHFYLLTLGVTAANLVFAWWAFRAYEQDAPAQLLSALERTASRRAAAEAAEPTKVQLFKQAVRNRTTILGALFIFAYQGAEVSISGWVISFLINYRDGDPARVGYVTAGFWAGITLGRFLLTHPAHLLGEHLSVPLLILGALASQLLIWLVPQLHTLGDALLVAVVGLLLGPIYPCATAVFARNLPRGGRQGGGGGVQVSALSVISAMGSAGGAVAPFLTGIVAQARGTWVLHPICVGLFVGMVGCWGGLPWGRSRKRVE